MPPSTMHWTSCANDETVLSKVATCTYIAHCAIGNHSNQDAPVESVWNVVCGERLRERRCSLENSYSLSHNSSDVGKLDSIAALKYSAKKDL